MIIHAVRRIFSRPTAQINDAGFSLTELLIVIVIVDILALLALPRFMGVTTRAKMTETKLALKQVHTLQQSYRYEFDRYADDLAALGYEANELVTEGGTARYTTMFSVTGFITYRPAQRVVEG